MWCFAFIKIVGTTFSLESPSCMIFWMSSKSVDFTCIIGSVSIFFIVCVDFNSSFHFSQIDLVQCLEKAKEVVQSNCLWPQQCWPPSGWESRQARKSFLGPAHPLLPDINTINININDAIMLNINININRSQWCYGCSSADQTFIHGDSLGWSFLMLWQHTVRGIIIGW